MILFTGISINLNAYTFEENIKACVDGDADVCFGLGAIYENALGVKQDHSKAAELYQKACDGGSAGGCSNLGAMYYSGRGVKKNYSKAKEYFYRACNGGFATGCKNYNILNKK